MALDKKIPTSADTYKRSPLKVIPEILLVQKREDLPSSEKDRLNNIINKIFRHIQNVKNVKYIEKIPVEEKDPPEVVIAREMDTYQKEISKRKKELAAKHRLSGHKMVSIFDNDPQIQIARHNLAESEAHKNAFLKKGMAEYLEGEDGQKLKETVREIIFAIHREIFQQGIKVYSIEAYSEDDLIILIYELVYEAFLWRKRPRKDPTAFIFFSHLKDAVRKCIDNGFLSLPHLLSALKHDNIEDLPIHRENCSKESSVLDPKWHWLLCNDLYEDHLKEKKPIELFQIIENIKITILAMTKQVMSNAPPLLSSGEDKKKERQKKDEENAIRFYEESLQHEDAAILKIMEQILNAQTITFLGKERAPEKLNFILRHYAPLAKARELINPYRDFVGAGIDFYSPELRSWYTDIQQQRLVRHFGLDHPDSQETLLKALLKEKFFRSKNNINNLIHEFLKNLHESDPKKAEDIQKKIRQKILKVFEPIHPGVIHMKIAPTPLEDFINREQLIENANYVPDIPLEDPLFEIVILVSSQNDIKKMIGKIIRVADEHEVVNAAGSKIPDYPQKGKLLYLTDKNFGGTARLRINTVKDEALAKRGVYTNQKKIRSPKYLRTQLQQTLTEAKLYKFSIIEAIEKIAQQNNIVVTTDIGERKDVCLLEGACGLDLATMLPESLRSHIVLHAKGVINKETDEKLKIIDPLQDKNYYRIEITEDIQFDLGHLPFCTSDKYFKIFQKYFKELPSAERKEKSLQRAEQYIQKLNNLFLIQDPEMIPLLCLDLFDEQRQNLLFRIGEGDIDPLKVLAHSVNRSCQAFTQLTIENRPGVLHTLTEYPEKLKINIEDSTQKSTGDTANLSLSFSFLHPCRLDSYEILKFFLRFTYMPEVKKITVDSFKSGLFQFPPHILDHKKMPEVIAQRV